MIVVADTSPLNYLILVEQHDVLRRLYGRIIVPHGVVAELLASGSPPLVRRWAAEPPEWFEIHDVVVPENSGLGDIDQGEAEAITLAIQLGAQALILIDDQDGRLVARQRGLSINRYAGHHRRGRGGGFHGPPRHATQTAGDKLPRLQRARCADSGTVAERTPVGAIASFRPTGHKLSHLTFPGRRR